MFTKPSVAPTTEEEETFSDLQCLISSGDFHKLSVHDSYLSVIAGEISTMVGWAIEQGKVLNSSEVREEVKALKESLRGTVTGRSQTNLAVLLFFVKKVG